MLISTPLKCTLVLPNKNFLFGYDVGMKALLVWRFSEYRNRTETDRNNSLRPNSYQMQIEIHQVEK